MHSVITAAIVECLAVYTAPNLRIILFVICPFLKVTILVSRSFRHLESDFDPNKVDIFPSVNTSDVFLKLTFHRKITC